MLAKFGQGEGGEWQDNPAGDGKIANLFYSVGLSECVTFSGERNNRQMWKKIITLIDIINDNIQ
jgi:hypothetical protein